MRLLSKALILLGIIVPMQVYALGLGELQTHSALNQPFDADLELLTTNPSELTGIQVKLASPEDFSRAGIERLPVLNALRFRVVKKAGRSYVHISSRQSILEPYLNFLVEVNWSRGRLLREFTVLLDPPELLGGEAAGVESPEAGESTPVSPPPRAPRREPLVSQMGIGEEDFPLVYGPIKKDEMLWNIASKMRGDLEATIPQVMMALLRNNPEAFIDNNVNRVKSGFVLRIDDLQAINAMSPAQARKAFQHQYQLWLDYKQRRAMAAAKRTHERELATQKREMQAEAGKPAAGTQEKQGVLTLERPQGEKPVGGHLESEAVGQGQESEELKRLRQELADAQQSAQSNQKENEAMHERLKAMEDQIAALQRLMSVRSDELTSLQQKLDSDEQVAEKPEEKKPQEKTPEEIMPPEEGFLQRLSDGFSGIIRQLRENPQTMGIIGGAVLLLLTTLLVIVRRRRKQGGVEEFSYAGGGRSSDFDMPMNEPWDSVNDYDEGVVEDWQQPVTETPVTHDEMEEDPITQADIFVAYGNLDAAIEVMETAVLQWPDKSDYQRKLIELKDKRDASPVEPVEDTLASDVIETPPSPMATPLEEETLLTDADLQAFEEEMKSDHAEAGHDEIHTAMSDFGIEMGEDKDLHPIEESKTPSWDSGKDEGLEFDLGDIHNELEQLTVDEDLLSASEHEGTIPEFDLQDLETDLEDSGFEEIGLEASGLGETAADEGLLEEAAPVAPQEPVGEIAFDLELPEEEVPGEEELEPEFDTDSLIELEDHEPDLLNDVDEVGTKLDLARAYIDMGDPEGARAILEEVVNEGNEHQVQEANGLLGQLQ